MQRLLIMSCSERKRNVSDLLPAIERYDGPTFHVLRRYLNLRNDALEVWVLSAAFGLIPASKPIPTYDLRMTGKRAVELREASLTSFSGIIQSCDTLCICLGKDYLPALEGFEMIVPSRISMTIINAAQGIRLAQLKRWLWGPDLIPKPSESTSPRKRQPTYPILFKGVRVTLELDEITKLVELELATEDDAAHSFRTWYTRINGQSIAPKWLVSKLTGVPVSQFTSGEARRLLSQLGIECYGTH